MRGLLVIVVATSVAHASPAAEKLFQDGRKLLKAGKLAEACDAFRRSNEIEPRAGTLLNLGHCEERRDRIATAWEVFVAARALATQTRDPVKTAEADKRAAALAPRLPYLTLRAPATRPPGFAVKRDGNDVPLAVLDHEVPIDPGQYELEASAPGHVSWKQPLTIAVGQKSVVEIPPLAPDPAAQAEVATTAAAPSPIAPVPTTAPAGAITASSASATAAGRRIGFGLGVGVSSGEGELMYGGRVVLQLARIGSGEIRAVPSVFYSEVKNIGDDPYHDAEVFALGLGLEYVAPLGPMFAVAAGLGVGLDLVDDTYDERTQKHGSGAVRLSPTLRLGRSLDIGLHVQAVFTSDDVVGVGQLGVDYFFR